MTTHAQSQFSLFVPPPKDTAFYGEGPGFRPPPNYVHSLNLPTITPTTEDRYFHQFCARKHSNLECIPFPWHENQVDTALSISTHVNQQTPHNPTLLRPTDIQMVSPISNLERHKTAHFVEADERASKSPHRLSERLQAITLLVCFADGPGPLPRRTAVTHDDCMTSASRFAYDPDPYGTCWDSHTAFGSPWILWPDPPDRRLLTHSIEQEKDIHDPGNHFPDELSTHRSLLHATYSHYPNVSNDQNVTNSIITSNLPSHGAFSPSLPYWYLRPTSNGYLESDPHSRLVPPQDSTASSRRRRGVRAVEYGGLWINEEELLEGLTESGVKLNVHQCLWEEDRAGRPVER